MPTRRRSSGSRSGTGAWFGGSGTPLLFAGARSGQNELCRDLESSFGSVRDTLVHILSAECVWCSRWQGHSPTEHLDAEEFGGVPAVRARWVEHERKVRAFIATLDDGDADRVFDYRVFSGQWTSSVLSEMLQHLVNQQATIAVRSPRCCGSSVPRHRRART